MPAVRQARLAGEPPSPKFTLTAICAGMVLGLGLASGSAHALTMGQLAIQSALGEPLRAEIEVTEATSAELQGLKVGIASTEAFRAAGVPYSPALSDLRASLQRRADGRYVVRLSSNRSVNEPFVDLLLEASWNSGRIVRDYTLLLDPPTRTAAAPVAPLAPQISSGSATAPARAPVLLGQAAAPQRRSEPVSQGTQPAANRSASPPASGEGGQQVTVRAGDTASKIAGAYKPADVSLDQMLVALLRANPAAFAGGNVNRLKSGAVLDLPTPAQLGGVTVEEARRTVTAQSRDFSEYRRRLADNAPATRVAEADRRAAGRLQANVDDRNASTASADRLKLSQSLSAGAATEEQLAKARETRDNNARVAELSKNISDLNRLQGTTPAATTPTAPSTSPATTPATTSGAAPASVAAAAAAAPALGTVTPPGGEPPKAGVPATVSESPAVPATAVNPVVPSAPAAATQAQPATPAPVAKPAPAGPTPAAATAPERSFFQELMDSPLVLGGAALLALLVGFLLYRLLGRRKLDATDSVFLESRMPKDSFFGASGGESVDTKDRGNSVLSSLSYSPSQLDAGDVDPVAEADVYLAYGRDLQAEEILREALRVNPERVAIHLKLLEIHAKRRDSRAFESTANDIRKLTQGIGPDWDRAAELGRELDPANPLYQQGSTGVSPAEAAAFAGTLAAATAEPASKPAASDPPVFESTIAPLDFNLGIDGTGPKPLAPSPEPSASLKAVVGSSAANNRAAAGMPTAPTLPEMRAPAAAAQSPAVPTLPAEAFDVPQFSPTEALELDQEFHTAPGALEAPSALSAAAPATDYAQPATLRAGLPGDSGFIEFDMSALGGLSDRGPAHTEPGRLENLEEHAENPHEVKLSLARELKALGDIDGARSLVEEVAAASSGEVNVEARQLLGQLR